MFLTSLDPTPDIKIEVRRAEGLLEDHAQLVVTREGYGTASGLFYVGVISDLLVGTRKVITSGQVLVAWEPGMALLTVRVPGSPLRGRIQPEALGEVLLDLVSAA